MFSKSWSIGLVIISRVVGLSSGSVRSMWRTNSAWKLMNILWVIDTQVEWPLTLLNQYSQHSIKHVHFQSNFKVVGEILQGPAANGKKMAEGRSRVCPNFYCSLLFTGIRTLNLWIYSDLLLHRNNMPPNMLGNCNKSLDIPDFYFLTPSCRTNILCPG